MGERMQANLEPARVFGGPVCKECIQKRIEGLLNLYRAEGKAREECLSALIETYSSLSDRVPPPVLLREAHRAVAQQFGKENSLWPVKRAMNDRALEQLSLLKMRLKVSHTPFALAARFVLAGLGVDFLRDSPSSIVNALDRMARAELTIDHSAALEKACRARRRVLYIGGRAGGIMLDRLLIQRMGSREIIYAVNSLHQAGLNVCGQDAAYADIRSCARVLETGCEAPVPLLDYASERFREAYRAAHTIVVVGQSALEALFPLRDPRLFVLMRAQCPCATEQLGLSAGQAAIFNLEQQLKKAHGARKR